MLKNNTYISKILFRRDTSINWSNNNPVLSEGEPGYELDTGLYKLGNGITTWNDLPYSNAFRATVQEVPADGKLYGRIKDVDAMDGRWEAIPEIPDISDKADKVHTQIHEKLIPSNSYSEFYFGIENPKYISINESLDQKEIRFEYDTTFFTIIQTSDNIIKVKVTKYLYPGEPVENTLYDGSIWNSCETYLPEDDIKFVFNSETRLGQFIIISTNTIAEVLLLDDTYTGENLIESLDLYKAIDTVYNLEDIYTRLGKVDDVKIINNNKEESLVKDKVVVIPNYVPGEHNSKTNNILDLNTIYSIKFLDDIITDFDYDLNGIHLKGSIEDNTITLGTTILFDGQEWKDSTDYYTIFRWDKDNKQIVSVSSSTPGFIFNGGEGTQPNWEIIGDINQKNGLLTKDIYENIVTTTVGETFIPIKVGDIANTLYLRKPETLPTETTLIGIKVEDEEEDRLAIALTPEGKITLENALNNFDGTGSELYNGTKFVSAGGTVMSVTIYFNEATGELRFVPISSIKGKNLVISNVPNIAAPTYIRGIKDNFDLSDMYIEYKTLADKKSIVDTFELSQNILEGYKDREICLNRTTGGNLLYGSYINITDAIMNAGETFTYKLPSGIWNVIQYSGIWNTYGDINEKYTIPFSSREFSCYIKQNNTNGVTFNIENNGDRDVTIGNASLYIVYNKEGE